MLPWPVLHIAADAQTCYEHHSYGKPAITCIHPSTAAVKVTSAIQTAMLAKHRHKHKQLQVFERASH